MSTSTIAQDNQLIVLKAAHDCLDEARARISHEVLPILRGAQSLATCFQEQGEVAADQEMSCSLNELRLQRGLEQVSELLRVAIDLLTPATDELFNIDLTD